MLNRAVMLKMNRNISQRVNERDLAFLGNSVQNLTYILTQNYLKMDFKNENCNSSYEKYIILICNP